MSDDRIYKKIYSQVGKISEREVWRYAGYMGVPDSSQDELKSVFDEVVSELDGAFSYQVCYRRLPLEWEMDDSTGAISPKLPFSYTSDSLNKCLAGSDEIIIFAATIGPAIDKKILFYEKTAATKALIAQAYGAERVEALCDTFCEEMRAQLRDEGKIMTPRFSPGYGDWSLEVQKEYFTVLDIYHQIGVSLGDSLLMRPSKSVTAIFGIKTGGAEECVDEHTTGEKCSMCSKEDCVYRKL